ncbi:hypothetical protein ANASTE_00465 [Anaerofustis stercorihominis DSM 17244]|uniref:DUF3795 domain-containing protein n=2 Tax=Anaerofustis stercorihominis TaxID=214853 RepID=B1C6W8_9FIRM|nr:hypothetical protein ANASTE_00465 [Anaerofustis stercorihominis DSM 17244]
MNNYEGVIYYHTFFIYAYVYDIINKRRYIMKMPEVSDEIMFAPCGMNCTICYRHCFSKRPCEGCLKGDRDKPKHCRVCKIKDCVREQGYKYCYECGDFPCKLIKNLERSYKKYKVSLIENSLTVREKGIGVFILEQREKYKCSECKGIISIHDRVCSECNKDYNEIL